METQKHRNTETHTDSDEYSIVVFCKNATIINCLLWRHKATAKLLRSVLTDGCDKPVVSPVTP